MVRRGLRSGSLGDVAPTRRRRRVQTPPPTNNAPAPVAAPTPGTRGASRPQPAPTVVEGQFRVIDDYSTPARAPRSSGPDVATTTAIERRDPNAPTPTAAPVAGQTTGTATPVPAVTRVRRTRETRPQVNELDVATPRPARVRRTAAEQRRYDSISQLPETVYVNNEPVRVADIVRQYPIHGRIPSQREASERRAERRALEYINNGLQTGGIALQQRQAPAARISRADLGTTFYLDGQPQDTSRYFEEFGRPAGGRTRFPEQNARNRARTEARLLDSLNQAYASGRLTLEGQQAFPYQPPARRPGFTPIDVVPGATALRTQSRVTGSASVGGEVRSLEELDEQKRVGALTALDVATVAVPIPFGAGARGARGLYEVTSSVPSRFTVGGYDDLAQSAVALRRESAITRQYGTTNIQPTMYVDAPPPVIEPRGGIGAPDLMSNPLAYPELSVPPQTFREGVGTARPSARPARRIDETDNLGDDAIGQTDLGPGAFDRLRGPDFGGAGGGMGGGGVGLVVPESPTISPAISSQPAGAGNQIAPVASTSDNVAIASLPTSPLAQIEPIEPTPLPPPVDIQPAGVVELAPASYSFVPDENPVVRSQSTAAVPEIAPVSGTTQAAAPTNVPANVPEIAPTTSVTPVEDNQISVPQDATVNVPEISPVTGATGAAPAPTGEISQQTGTATVPVTGTTLANVPEISAVTATSPLLETAPAVAQPELPGRTRPQDDIPQRPRRARRARVLRPRPDQDRNRRPGTRRRRNVGEITWEGETRYRLNTVTGDYTSQPISDRNVRSARITKLTNRRPRAGTYRAGHLDIRSGRRAANTQTVDRRRRKATRPQRRRRNQRRISYR